MNTNLRSLLNYRQQGNTLALVDMVTGNKNIRMIVDSTATAKSLQSKYSISKEQLIVVYRLHDSLLGTTGPVVVDIRAINELLKYSEDAVLLKFLYSQLTSEVRSRWGNSYEEFTDALRMQMSLINNG